MKWNYKEEFEYEINRKRLKTTFMQIVKGLCRFTKKILNYYAQTLCDKENKVIADAEINLYETVTGPVHHDVALLKNSVY